MRLKMIGVLSTAKFAAAFYAAMAVIFIVPAMLIMTAVMAAIPHAQQQNGAFAWGGMIGFLIVAPFFYAGMGFLFGALGAWMYNWLAARMGGIEMEFENLRPTGEAMLP